MQNLNLKGWNSHVHGEFLRIVASPNLSREIGRTTRERSEPRRQVFLDLPQHRQRIRSAVSTIESACGKAQHEL